MPDDPDAVAVLIRRKLTDVKKAWPKVRDCWIPNGEPGQIVNKRQEKERAEAFRKSEQGKKAVGIRYGRMKSVATESLPKSYGRIKSVDHSVDTESIPRAFGSGSSEELNTETGSLVFDLAAAFREIWKAYPQKGRTMQADSERQYAELMFVLPVEQQIELHAEILAAILGKWATSDVWRKGFVMKLSEWLRNRRWIEDPEQADAGSADTHQESTRYEPEWTK